ncbi:SIR2 family protein [Curtobacterium flaccumfaciens]|uniref:SIR2 family protein n=1 Tax=Curtobacterium flaccumfaciens TaxID=2035 RepID=UPI001E4FBD8C|nr:SIR2 family protein [Curtobacterium allii]MCE0459125.1 SIR2 family protein [Curtobacterium allii]
METTKDRFALPRVLESVEGDRRVAILGAGFSRAISEKMPTIKSLGGEVLKYMGFSEEDGPLDEFDQDLERWMSYLSADQPWLSEADNLRNRSVFVEAAEAVEAVITAAEEEAVSAPLPPWLERLVWTWAEQGADVFTFNYDTLVERAVSSIPGLGTLADLYATPLSQRHPPGSSGGLFAISPPSRSMFRLYKLHGSTNWSFTGLASPLNDPIVLTRDRPLWRPTAQQDNPVPRFVPLYDGLAPLIVPPTFSKGPYYGNLALRAQWRRGATALSRASDVAILGYSFPPGDLTTREWVGTSLSRHASVSIADLSAASADRIGREVGKRRQVSTHTGATAIQDYVDVTCGDLVAWRIVTDANIVRLEVSVNGSAVDLPGAGRFDQLEDAARWIEARIDAQAPRRTDAARNEGTDWEILVSRSVVMPSCAPHVVFAD